VVLLIFPLANHFNPHSGQKSLGRVIFEGIWHIRSTCIIAMIAGIIFSLLKIPYPSWIKGYHLMQILIVVGAFITYAVIGLNLHLGDIRKYIRLYFTQAGVKFVVAPLMALLMISLFGLKFHDLPAKVVLTQGFMPAGVYSVLLSNIFGLNARLASALFVVNTGLFLLVILPLLALFV
jgi:predicted permease